MPTRFGNIIDGAGRLKQIPLARILDTLAQAGTLLSDTRSNPHADAADALSRSTGWSAEMASLALHWTFSEWTRANFDALIRGEFADASWPDRHAHETPQLIAVIAAGSIPQPAVNEIAFALMLKSGVFVKLSAHEHEFIPHLISLIQTLDMDIGAAVDSAYWKGGDDPRGEAMLKAAGAVVCYGGDGAVRAVRDATPEGAPLATHGHKISVAAVGRDALSGPSDALDPALRLARDIAMYEQSGCLSPHAVFVESGAKVKPETFSSILYEALGQIGRVLPQGNVDFETIARVKHLRAEYEMTSYRDGSVNVYATADYSRTVIFDPRPDAEISSVGGRCVMVLPIDSLDNLPLQLSRLNGGLQSVGAEPLVRLDRARPELEHLGASRVCELGKMQRPPLDWKNAGLPCLRSKIR